MYMYVYTISYPGFLETVDLTKKLKKKNSISMLKAWITFSVIMFKSLMRLGDKSADSIKAGGFSSSIANFVFL